MRLPIKDNLIFLCSGPNIHGPSVWEKEYDICLFCGGARRWPGPKVEVERILDGSQ